MEVIVTTAEQLSHILRYELDRALNTKPQPPQVSDRCTFEDALEITGLSKSKLYKLTAAKEIPFKVFGSRLIFSRKELAAWIESQTVEHNTGNVSLAIARSARSKSKKA